MTGGFATDGRGTAPDAALAAIDIGTNSIHLVVARVAANDRFEVVAREREMVRLGSGPGDMFSGTCLTPSTAPTIRRLAELAPTTIAVMHGSSFTGNGAAALNLLADDYEARLTATSMRGA